MSPGWLLLSILLGLHSNALVYFSVEGPKYIPVEILVNFFCSVFDKTSILPVCTHWRLHCSFFLFLSPLSYRQEVLMRGINGPWILKAKHLLLHALPVIFEVLYALITPPPFKHYNKGLKKMFNVKSVVCCIPACSFRGEECRNGNN